ncbi:MAG: M16 family metallopeptidase [Planctomycetaceae bacterium]
MRTTSRIGFTLLFAVAFGPAAHAADRVKKITTIEGITEYRLDNGMKVLLFPDASKPTVTVNLTVFVGSRHEGYGESGMAHLLEHMLFKGTPTHKHLPKALQDRGASFNGTTWLDRTNYFETLPATGDNLEFAIRLEADRMMNSLILAKDLKSEMTVVRNEFERGENSPRNILEQRMTAVAYEWHNYGKSTIGNRADIERVPVAKLRVFYRRYYQPDNAMVIVAGKFKEETALKLIGKYFGGIPRPKRKLRNTYTEEPPQDGERLVTLRRVGDVSVVGSMYHICSGPHPDFASVDVLESILTSPPSGRLYKAMVKTRRAASVSGSAYPLHDPGIVQFFAEVNKGSDPRGTLDIMLDTLDAVAARGVTKDEVDRAKRRLLKQRELQATNSRRIAVQLSEWAAQGDWRLYYLYRDRLEKVTKESVDAVAKKYLKRNNRTVGLFIPTKAPEKVAIPGTPNIAAMIGNYKGRKTVVAGEVFDPTPANIESRTKRTTLSSGAKVALLPKRTRGRTVNLQITLRYGNVENLKGKAAVASLLPSLMLRGTKRLTRQQLQDELDKYKARLSASGSAGTVSFSLQTKRETLPQALKLLREVLRTPTLPEAELEILKRSALARAQQGLSNPQTLAVNLVRRQLDPYPRQHPRYVPTISENIGRIKAVTQRGVRKLYDDYVGGQHALITVVGDFDEKTVLNSLEETLSGWEAKQPYQRIARTRGSGKTGIRKDILTPGKANAIYFAAMTLPLGDDDADYPALTLGNFILGGGSLSSRLGDRVRQKEGLSYGVGSMFQSSSLDKRSAFMVFAITNPNNVPKLKTVIREELDKILKTGVTEKELIAAKKGYLQRLRLSRTNDGSLAGQLLSNLQSGRKMTYYARLEKRIESVTAKQVLDALQKYLKLKRLHIVAAGDLKPAKTPKK